MIVTISKIVKSISKSGLPVESTCIMRSGIIKMARLVIKIHLMWLKDRLIFVVNDVNVN